MKKTSLFAGLLLAVPAVANAGGQGGSVGLGAEFQLNGAGGASLNYDAGRFHVGGFLGFFDPAGRRNSTFDIGARFYFHVHSTAMADFGLGGGVGVISVPPMTPADPNSDRTTNIYLEPSFQIRLFIASNVAFSFTTGVIIGVGDDRTDGISGQGATASIFTLGAGVGVAGGAGVHYYFF